MALISALKMTDQVWICRNVTKRFRKMNNGLNLLCSSNTPVWIHMTSEDIFLSSAAPLLMKKKSTRDFLPVVWSDKIASKWQNCHFWLNGSFKQWPSWDFSVALMKKIKANDSVWIRGSPWLRAALWELADPFPTAPWTGSDDQLDNGHILNTTRLGSPPPPPPAVIRDSLLTTGRARLQLLWCKALLPSQSLRNVKQSK